MDPDAYTAVCMDGPLIGQTITVHEHIKPTSTRMPSFLIPVAISFNLFVAEVAPGSSVRVLEYRWIDWPVADGFEIKAWSCICQTCRGYGRLPACNGFDHCECKSGELVDCPDCAGIPIRSNAPLSSD